MSFCTVCSFRPREASFPIVRCAYGKSYFLVPPVIAVDHRTYTVTSSKKGAGDLPRTAALYCDDSERL